MPVNVVSANSNNPRVQALRERHAALSQEIDNARRLPSTTDFYLKQLKKQKLLIKEKISMLADGLEEAVRH